MAPILVSTSYHIDMEMEIGTARCNPLDAQRFDPLRRTRTVSVSFDFIFLHLTIIVFHSPETRFAFQHRHLETDDGAGPLRQDQASKRG